jgi:hypothetical protein
MAALGENMNRVVAILLLSLLAHNSHALDPKYFGSYSFKSGYMSIWLTINDKEYITRISSDVKIQENMHQPEQFIGEYIEKDSCIYIPTSRLTNHADKVTAFNHFSIYCPIVVNGELLLSRQPDGLQLKKHND